MKIITNRVCETAVGEKSIDFGIERKK